ncbi:MAG: hypothetical protein QHH06_12725 [Clostridiales bacterium]|jgi:hypothetical protein|nr:hypothetical protein [Eubacteriales bacterium]MDH7567312.1 hypothetical protein [Clostridiales bacterium]
MQKYIVNKRNHWWVDAGISGLYYIAQCYKDVLEKYDVSVYPERDALIFQYNEEANLRAFLSECYTILTDRHWNISTKKQEEEKELVIYNKEEDRLSLAPKRIPKPVANLFVGARSWRGEGLPYDDLDEEMKQRVDLFLKKNNRELWGKKRILLYGPPVCHQDLEMLPPENRKRKPETCCICGKSTSNYLEVGLPSYLLFASSSAAKSFNSQAKSPDNLCWECDFLSKFALESVGYKKTGPDLFIIQAHSPDMEKLINIQNGIGTGSIMREFDKDSYWTNLKSGEGTLVSRANKPYELLWAFFYDIYDTLYMESNTEEAQDDEDPFYEFLNQIHSFHLQVFMLHASDSGNTFITRELIIYQDTSYAFLLMRHLKEKGIDLKAFFNGLWDWDKEKNQNLIREKVLRNILKKRSVLQIVERYCFQKVINETGYFSTSLMLNFLCNYEPEIRRDCMDKLQIETAVNLGKQIVRSSIQSEQGMEQLERGKKESVLHKLRGDLFTLRKTRTKTDFLTQLSNLQFRYGIAVPNEILSGMLEQVDFEEFRAYCIMGALNVYAFEIGKIKKNPEVES